MNRNQWKTAFRAARMGDQSALHAMGISAGFDAINGRTYRRAIIRDRSPYGRIADSMAWARFYRESARQRWRDSYWRELARVDASGARACVADCAAIRAEMSVFHRLP